MTFVELAGACAAITAVLGAGSGFLAWLVAPRFRAMVEDVVESKVGRVETKLDDQLEDKPDTIGRHAKVAAAAAAELPEMRRQLNALTAGQASVNQWRERFDRRLLIVEEIVLALVGPELRKRMLDELDHTATPTHREDHAS